MALLICIRYSSHPEGHIFYLNRFHLQLFADCLFSFQGFGNSRVRPDDKPANERREALQVPKGLLDFSSGSEEDEFLKNSVDTKKGGNAATVPMSLQQHGFSKLLERVTGKPELIEEESCPSIEESSEEAEDQQGNATSSVPSNPDNHARLQRKASGISSSSDGEDREEGRNDKISGAQSDESVRSHHGKKWTKMGGNEGQEGRGKFSPIKSRHSELSRAYHAEAYSDESEDLDMEITTRCKGNTSGCNEGTRRRKRVDFHKKRRRESINFRSNYSEDREMFTSSEEEHTPFKKGKRAGSHVTSAKSASSKSSSPKCHTSPTSSRGTGAIDCVLGQVHSNNYYGNLMN